MLVLNHVTIGKLFEDTEYIHPYIHLGAYKIFVELN